MVPEFITDHCIGCHDGSGETELDLTALGFSLHDTSNLASWEKVYDRVANGEMPPAGQSQPPKHVVNAALKALSQQLSQANRRQQAVSGRVPARRLTKRELQLTLEDVFLIQANVTGNVPDEVEAGSFDTVGINQRISAVHIESYLQVADAVLAAAIQLGKNPFRDYGDFADNNFSHLTDWHEKPLNLGGSVTRPLKDETGVALFRDIDYLTQFTYNIHQPGVYRLTTRIAAYQSQHPITAKFIVKEPSGSARLIKSLDLQPDEPEDVSVETFLKPGDVPYLTYQMPGTEVLGGVFLTGAKFYPGPGLAIYRQQIEGPIHQTWPPESTQKLLSDFALEEMPSGSFRVIADDPLAAIEATVGRIGPELFRRELDASEIDAFVALAKPVLAAGRSPVDALKVSMRGLLSSPSFMIFDGSSNDSESSLVASRLAYFLTQGPPDNQLRALGESGELLEPSTLHATTERLLDSPKSRRFVNSFVGQWLRV
ncbi:MAG TPA: hypothetical protein DDW52_26810, partial [Planctomycetaceae bacterium]|nr:hypothetical protein [Planctomycetaceae bacterium]